MTQLEIWSLVVLVLVGVAWYLTYTAARLDRLHTRVEGTFAALDAQLVRRAEAALELANAQLIDPASALFLAGAASASLDEAVGDLEDGLDFAGDREQVESELTQALRLTIPPEVADDLRSQGGRAEEVFGRLETAHERAALARRFHNDAVTDAGHVRRKASVRLFRLAGRTPMPRTVEIDDDLTAAA